MPIKGLAVHVVTTKRKVGDKVYQTHLLRHSYREGDQVKSKTVANLSSLPDHLIEVIRLGLKGEPVGPAASAMELVESRPHGHVAAVVGTMRTLGFDRLFATRKSREKDLALALVAGRVLHPGSKLSLSRLLDAGSRSSTLGQVLGVEGADENELYGAMDWLVARQSKIEDTLAKRHLTNGCLVLYDVSSSYFEGKTCPLGVNPTLQSERAHPTLPQSQAGQGNPRWVNMELRSGATWGAIRIGWAWPIHACSMWGQVT